MNTSSLHQCLTTAVPFQHSDAAFGRVMSTELPDNQNVTVESCVASCSSQNFTLAGLEFSGQSFFVIREFREPHYPTVQCFCDNELIDGAVIASESDCDMGCGGNAT